MRARHEVLRGSSLGFRSWTGRPPAEQRGPAAGEGLTPSGRRARMHAHMLVHAVMSCMSCTCHAGACSHAMHAMHMLAQAYVHACMHAYMHRLPRAEGARLWMPLPADPRPLAAAAAAPQRWPPAPRLQLSSQPAAAARRARGHARALSPCSGLSTTQRPSAPRSSAPRAATCCIARP